MSRMTTLTLHTLFARVREGRLIPSRPGERLLEYVSRRDGIPVDQLFERHAYFRMLHNLSFLFGREDFEPYRETARVVVRDFLDSRYLRLSLACIMPEVDEFLLPRDLRWLEDDAPSVPKPEVGRYGILHRDDLLAWRAVEKSFREMGFVLMRQLGIGQFGRVYEAVNFRNSRMPRRVALKVDRLHAAGRSARIERPETILQIGHKLAHCPHVIRVFDAGRMRKPDIRYHILQLVDGDTLDNLIGVTGTEHASIPRPERRRSSLRELHHETSRALRSHRSESWRRDRLSRPFTRSLSIPKMLDLLTSIFLWVESVHAIGLAVNDLKNGNLMVSRRGQLKGIDLDSYSPAFGELDRRTDFFFLSISVLLLLSNFRSRDGTTAVNLSDLLQEPERLRPTIDRFWPVQDVASLCHGRVTTPELTRLMLDILSRSRDGSYAANGDLFRRDVDRVISTKRAIRPEEIVQD